MRHSFKATIYASYLGFITQAIIVNLAPLLFVTFRQQYDIPLDKIGLLISLNFGVQMLTDLAASLFVDKTGFRVPVVAAHVFSALGLALMGVLPPLMADPYVGLMIATVLMAIGGGLIEVLLSPIVEACPGDAKAAAMSLLHSFYSWGQVAVVLLSTGYFVLFGAENWMPLPVLWAAIPAVNIAFFCIVPLGRLVKEHQRIRLRELFSKGMFWALLILMVGAGAAEQAMAQWSSLFAELGLKVPKVLGDLLGPCAFAVLMGVSRVYFGMRGNRLNIKNALSLSAGLCLIGYLVCVFSPWPLVSLMGCALCGLAVGIMWPGTISLSASCYPQGGGSMYAILAFAGDIGCATGPGLVGLVSSAAVSGTLPGALRLFSGEDATQAGLRLGLLLAIVFPVIIILGVNWLRKKQA